MITLDRPLSERTFAMTAKEILHLRQSKVPQFVSDFLSTVPVLASASSFS